MAAPAPVPAGFLQRLISRLLPADLASEIEAGTREWTATCPEGHRHDLWQLGGLRWRAKGGKQTLAHCPTCGRPRMMRVRQDGRLPG